MKARVFFALSLLPLFAVPAACGNGDDAYAPVPFPDAAAHDATMPDGIAQDAAEAGDAGDGEAGSVALSVDLTKGPASQVPGDGKPRPVSEYIYGINAGIDGNSAKAYFTSAPTRWGLVRQGGDALTAWNWTNNYSNSGSDYCFVQSAGNGGVSVAGLLAGSGDTITSAQRHHEAFLATVPITDFVSAAYDNTSATCPATGSNCSGGSTSTTRVNAGDLPFATPGDGGAAFVPNVAAKPDGGFCTCAPGDACDAGCTVASSPIYQDEFVNYLKTTYGDGGAPIFFDLDNEPNYWGGTHPELWPSTGALPCQTYTVGYDDIVDRNVAFASAVKAAWPQAKIFGPVVSADGLVYAHTYSDPPRPAEFLDYYLARMAAASADAGAPLLDALDVHYYTNALGQTGPAAAQCMQSPRLFWDPNYTSLSKSATDRLDFGYSGVNGYFDINWYPRQLVPRLLRKIAAAYGDAGTAAPGLAITEYNSGCESTIAGGVAQADVLGVLGREGAFAATAFPLQSLWSNYLVAAFDLYRSYDGKGAVVGDTAVQATTSDPVNTSVYAFTHSDDASALDLVAINKTATTMNATIQIAGAASFAQATAYELVDGEAVVVPVPSATPVTCSGGGCTLTYAMPPTSATTLVLRAGASAGNPAPAFVKVDDMESGDDGPVDYPAPAGDSRGGWFDYESTGSTANTIAPSPFAYATLTSPHATMPGVSSTRAAHVKCSIADQYGVCQMGLSFASAPVDGGTQTAPVDLSAYGGITFWARSDAASTALVMFPDVDTIPAGGRCGTACYDHFEAPVTLTADWKQYTVHFASLHPDGAPFAFGYVPPSGAFDPTQVYQIIFSVNGPSSSGAPAVDADVWVDDVYLFANE